MVLFAKELTGAMMTQTIARQEQPMNKIPDPIAEEMERDLHEMNSRRAVIEREIAVRYDEFAELQRRTDPDAFLAQQELAPKLRKMRIEVEALTSGIGITERQLTEHRA